MHTETHAVVAVNRRGDPGRLKPGTDRCGVARGHSDDDDARPALTIDGREHGKAGGVEESDELARRVSDAGRYDVDTDRLESLEGGG
jgi:hypothetical protein